MTSLVFLELGTKLNITVAELWGCTDDRPQNTNGPIYSGIPSNEIFLFNSTASNDGWVLLDGVPEQCE